MITNRKKSTRGSIGLNGWRRSSSIENNTGVNIRVDNDCGKEPLLERMLRFKSDDNLFKWTSEGEDDHDLPSILEFAFSDDDDDDQHNTMMIRQPIDVQELQKLLDDEDNAFSTEYLNILKEIDDEKGPFSLPCSTCSLCSSCTTDTWDRLNITDDCLHIKPTPLVPEELEELSQLENEHFESINALLSSIKIDDDNDNGGGGDDEYSSTSSIALTKKKDFDDTRLSVNKEKIRKEMFKTQQDFSYEQYIEQTEPWTDSLTNYDDFFISPPDYDYYQDVKSRDDLIESDTIPWSVKERSRNKCTKWLDNNEF